VVALLLAIAPATSAFAQRALPLGAQVEVVAPNDVPSAALLRDALSAPRRVLVVDSGRTASLTRSESYRQTIVIIGGNATVASVVRGDVIVVGGDLFVHPGASVDGQAIAIGGAVYPSALVRIAKGTRSFRDQTYDLQSDGNKLTLTYRAISVERASGIQLPLLRGLRIPTYDRVDGLSLSWGPLFHPRDSLEIEPLVTLRTNLGDVDASLHTVLGLGRQRQLRLALGRETATNERWIRGDILNSLTTFLAGDDVRNYYRRDAASLTMSRERRIRRVELTLTGGVATERDWSVGPTDSSRSSPWSIVDRHEIDGMLRPNPRIERGRISSVLARAQIRWRLDDVMITADLAEELPWQAPRSARFAQTTSNIEIAFPTFGSQRLTISGHTMFTAGDSTPRQRWSYLGGPGTLSVFEAALLFGGDEVLFVESRYEIPFERVRLPLVGSPTLVLRHLVGSAGVHELPAFTQNAGARLVVGFARVEYLVDPASREHVWKFGLSAAK
jgi:hypothetical protein